MDVLQIAHVNLVAGFRGGERQIQLLVEGLARRGWRQRLVARRDEPLAARCAGLEGLEVASVSNNVFSALRALAGVDLVHVHEGRGIQAAWLNRILRGAPYLITRRNERGPAAKWINRVMYARAAGRVAISSAVAESLKRLDRRLDSEIVPSSTGGLSTDPARAAAIRARYLQSENGLLVGNVAALVDSHKGQKQIVEVARRLAGAEPALTFLLVGQGRDEALLKSAAAGLPNLHFAGFVENVGDYLQAMDLFFFPSRHEGLGSVLLDALEFGLPVVATRVGGIPEIVEDQVNGLLCAVDEVGVQAASLLRLARDPGLREWIAAANRAKAAAYSPERMVESYAAIYGRL